MPLQPGAGPQAAAAGAANGGTSLTQKPKALGQNQMLNSGREHSCPGSESPPFLPHHPASGTWDTPGTTASPAWLQPAVGWEQKGHAVSPEYWGRKEGSLQLGATQPVPLLF